MLELSERMSMTAAKLERRMSFVELYDRMDLDRVHAEEREQARAKAG